VGKGGYSRGFSVGFDSQRRDLRMTDEAGYGRHGPRVEEEA
jgi:hypothetical protein